MKIKYVHTNIIAKDWESLADFYIKVFDCVPKPPKRDQKGAWLDKGLGIKNAHLQGMHLSLPGYGAEGPTLEIYQYSEVLEKEKSLPNTQGLGHLSFQVDKVAQVLEKALENGAQKIGEISSQQIEGVGFLQFIYVYDPENNIIEIQSWD